MKKFKNIFLGLFLLSIFVGTSFLLIGCGETSKLTLYNTKNMTDEQITSYFSQSVLEDVKADSRHRTIIIYDIDDSLVDKTEIKWILKDNQDFELTSDAETGIYVDKDAPNQENKIVKIMIGWAEEDLDKDWSVEIYYMNGAEKVELAKTTFKVSKADYVKE